jgi:hypothetical protein
MTTIGRPRTTGYGANSNERCRSVYPTCRALGCDEVPDRPHADNETGEWCASHLSMIRTSRMIIRARCSGQLGRIYTKRKKAS